MLFHFYTIKLKQRIILRCRIIIELNPPIKWLLVTCTRNSDDVISKWIYKNWRVQSVPCADYAAVLDPDRVFLP